MRVETHTHTSKKRTQESKQHNHSSRTPYTIVYNHSLLGKKGNGVKALNPILEKRLIYKYYFIEVKFVDTVREKPV
jgi:hypothetical protein